MLDVGSQQHRADRVESDHRRVGEDVRAGVALARRWRMGRTFGWSVGLAVLAVRADKAGARWPANSAGVHVVVAVAGLAAGQEQLRRLVVVVAACHPSC